MPHGPAGPGVGMGNSGVRHLAALCVRPPSALRSLDLWADGNPLVGTEGVEAFHQALAPMRRPPNLRFLRIRLSAALSPDLPAAVERLRAWERDPWYQRLETSVSLM